MRSPETSLPFSLEPWSLSGLFSKMGTVSKKSDLREEEKGKIASHPSEAASPNVFHQLSLPLLLPEWKAGAGSGHQRIDKSPLFWSLDFQKQDSGDTGLHH